MENVIGIMPKMKICENEPQVGDLIHSQKWGWMYYILHIKGDEMKCKIFHFSHNNHYIHSISKCKKERISTYKSQKMAKLIKVNIGDILEDKMYNEIGYVIKKINKEITVRWFTPRLIKQYDAKYNEGSNLNFYTLIKVKK